MRGSVTRKDNAIDLLEEGRFAVEKRPRESDEYVMTLKPAADGPGKTTKFPTIDNGGGALGLYDRQPPPFDDIRIATAASGPNKGLSYVVSIPGIPASLVNLTFAIFPGDPWYEAHPDTPGPLNDLGLPICTKSQIDKLRLEVERHEGLTRADNSHYGVHQALLRKWRLGTFIGSHVISMTGSPEQIRQRMALDFATEWLAMDTHLHPLQVAFDATDTPAIFAGLGCSIYLKS